MTSLLQELSRDTLAEVEGDAFMCLDAACDALRLELDQPQWSRETDVAIDLGTTALGYVGASSVGGEIVVTARHPDTSLSMLYIEDGEPQLVTLTSSDTVERGDHNELSGILPHIQEAITAYRSSHAS